MFGKRLDAEDYKETVMTEHLETIFDFDWSTFISTRENQQHGEITIIIKYVSRTKK